MTTAALRSLLLPVALVGTAFTADPVLQGKYTLGLLVADVTLAGPGEITPGENGTFTGSFTYSQPYTVTFTFAGRIAGDSVFFDGKYTDATENCTGTLKARGTIADAGEKARGLSTLSDSCRGELPADWSLTR